jgi:hypothetical protein
MTSIARDPEPWDFDGFPLPGQNWHRIPNDWVNVRARLARRRELATVVLLEYILRHTWGYAEYGIPKAITMDEFIHGRKRTDRTRLDEGTGLSERAIRDSIKVAVDLGLLLMTVDDSDKARVKRSFCLRMAEVVEDEGQTLPEGGQTLPPDPPSLPPRAARKAPRSEKEPELEPMKEGEGKTAASGGARLARPSPLPPIAYKEPTITGPSPEVTAMLAEAKAHVRAIAASRSRRT